MNADHLKPVAAAVAAAGFPNSSVVPNGDSAFRVFLKAPHPWATVGEVKASAKSGCRFIPGGQPNGPHRVRVVVKDGNPGAPVLALEVDGSAAEASLPPNRVLEMDEIPGLPRTGIALTMLGAVEPGDAWELTSGTFPDERTDPAIAKLRQAIRDATPEGVRCEGIWCHLSGLVYGAIDGLTRGELGMQARGGKSAVWTV